MGARLSEFDRILGNMIQMGWAVRNGRAGHKVVTSPTGQTLTLNVRTGDLNRGAANQRAEIRRIGYDEAWAEYQTATKRPAHPPRAAFQVPEPDAPTVGMYTRTEMIDPSRAADLLERPPSRLSDGSVVQQRNLSTDWVNTICGWIERGEWRESPEGFVIAADGGLLEGMHRCWAIVQTGETVPVRITYGVDPELFMILNQGRRRTTANVLQTHGEGNATHLASAIKCFWAYDQWCADPLGAPTWRQWHATSVSSPQVVATLAAHPRLRDLLKPASSMISPIRGNLAAATTWYYLADRAWPLERRLNGGLDPLARFIQGVRTGEMMAKGDPVLALRDWISNQRGHRAVDKRERQLLGLIKAWNLTVREREMNKMVIGVSEDMQKLV